MTLVRRALALLFSLGMVLVAIPKTGAVAASAPRDRAYPGLLRLSVDGSDTDRHIVHVHETLSGVTPDTVLLYPKWLPGTHAPEGPIDRLAGLKITAQGAPVPWTRDPLDVYAFQLHASPVVKTIDIEFDYLSPTSANVGKMELGHDLLLLEWNALVLYPAGYYVSRIPVQADVTLPAGWSMASALEPTAPTAATVPFKPVTLETLIDSPLYAGRYSARWALDPGGPAQVSMDVFSERPENLVVQPEHVLAYQRLVAQARLLFASHHYAHYDFLYSVSDQIERNGLEHHQSSEDGGDPASFSDWDKSAYARDLLPHEFTHSWNGKFRRPADLWVPNYNEPMQGSLLWVYEGQTQYWGQVLSARSGLWTVQQARDQLAITAASYEYQAGRQWRALQDTTNDEIMNARRPLSWRSWQRFEDYYSEGQLIWLDIDTLIREKSGGKRSLDDFASAFFGINDGSVTPVTYTFADVVKALDAVVPYEWAPFLRARLDGIAKPAPLDGLRRGGYDLVYSEVPTDTLKARDAQRKRLSLQFSIGVEIDANDDTLLAVYWGSPAFKARLTEGDKIIAVNGAAYSGDLLKDAIQAAKNPKSTLELIVKSGDRYSVVSIDYHAGLRYPRLERNALPAASLDAILTAR